MINRLIILISIAALLIIIATNLVICALPSRHKAHVTSEIATSTNSGKQLVISPRISLIGAALQSNPVILVSTEPVHFNREEAVQWGLTEEEGKTLWNWYRLREFGGNSYRQKAAHIGAICLTHRLSRAAISTLIGPYSHSGPSWVYFNIAPSQTMYFIFDTEGIIKSVKINGKSLKLNGTLE